MPRLIGSIVLLLGVGLSLGLVACTSAPSQSPITPAPDSPTFLYFYTDG